MIEETDPLEFNEMFNEALSDKDLGFFNDSTSVGLDPTTEDIIYAVIDGDGLPYKVSFWNKDLEYNEANKTKVKEDTISCVIGVYNKIKKFTKATYVLGFIDKKEGSFRRDIYPDYKLNRKASSTDYQSLWNPYIKEVLVEYGFYQIRDNIEVDDAMAIIGKKAIDLNIEMYLCGVDKDLLQIEGKHFNYDKETVTIVDSLGTITKRKQGKKNVIEGTGFIWLMAQCIIGDSSDNIPGLPSSGPVAAYDTLKDCTSYFSCIKAVLTKYKESFTKLSKGKAKTDKIKDLLEMSPIELFKLNYKLLRLLTTHESLEDGFTSKEEVTEHFSKIEDNNFKREYENIQVNTLEGETSYEAVNMSSILEGSFDAPSLDDLFA